MFSLLNITLFKVGPSVNAIGHIGGHAEASAEKLAELTVPWHKLIPGEKSVFSLLSWHTSCSEFAGRDKEMGLLADWANANHPVWVKFVIGDGGVGKSRLGAEFATKLQNKGWAAGFVDLRHPVSFKMHKAGTLLVIDYPEERIVEVREFLRDLTFCQPPSPLRVLFLTRQTPDKWDEIISGASADNIVESNPLTLSRLQPSDAKTIYDTTAFCATDQLDQYTKAGLGAGRISEEAMADWLKQAPENERALFIMAAAVHSAEDPEREIVEYTGREVVQALARREVKRFQGMALGRGLKDEFCLARILAMAAIAEELSLDDIRTIIADGKVPLGCKADDDIHGELTTAGLLDGGFVRAPKPDILAAAFVVDVLSRRPEYAPETVWAALQRDVEGGLERIGRLCWDAEIVLGVHDDRLSTWLAQAIDGDLSRANTLGNFFIDVAIPQGWLPASVEVSRTLAENASNMELRGVYLSNLSVRLRAVGDSERALESARKAVDVFRGLVFDDPQRIEPLLARSLNNLSPFLLYFGHKSEALDAILEAVKVLRRLVAQDRTQFEPDLASSLNNLSTLLSESSDKISALEASREAVDVYRALSLDDPQGFQPKLALALNNHSNRLSDLGDKPKALTAISEATEIHRRLASANPARFEPDLATSLNNLSNRQSDLGDTAGALESIREAVEIRRRLASSNPARFEPDLARSLGAQGSVLRKIGKGKEAAQSFSGGISLIRPYAERWPGSPHERLLRNLERDLKGLEES